MRYFRCALSLTTRNSYHKNVLQTPYQPKTQRNKAYLALLGNTLIWGAALPIVKPALFLTTPYHYLFYRYLIAAVFSLPFLAFLLLHHKPKLKTVLTISALEFLQVTAALSFLYAGLQRTTSLEATLIANASPVFIILGGILFLKEKEEAREFMGLLLAIAGVTLLTLEPLVSTTNLSFSFFGNLLVLGHNLFWTAYVLLAKHFYKDVPKLLIGFLSLWVGLVSFFVLSLLTTPGFSPATLLATTQADLSEFPVLFAAAYMAILGSIVAVPAYIYGNNLIEASEASLFFYLQPAVTIPLSVLWLKEPLTFPIVVALILSTAGVVIAQHRKRGG